MDKDVLPPAVLGDGFRTQLSTIRGLLIKEEEEEEDTETPRSGTLQIMLREDRQELLPPQERKRSGQTLRSSSNRDLVHGETKGVVPRKEEQKDIKQRHRRSSLENGTLQSMIGSDRQELLPPQERKRSGQTLCSSSIRDLVHGEAKGVVPRKEEQKDIKQRHRRSSLGNGISQGMIRGDRQELLPPQERKRSGQTLSSSSNRDLVHGEAKGVLAKNEEQEYAKQRQPRSSLGKERKAPSKTCRSLRNNREPPSIIKCKN
jgi:hypothetical protein